MSNKSSRNAHSSSHKSSHVEIEAKFEVVPGELERVKDQLIALGATLIARRQAEDNELFDFEDGRFRQFGCTLRLRSYGKDHLLTFKGPVQPDAKLKKRDELETAVTRGTVIRQILIQLGLRVTFRYSKFREIFQLQWQGGPLQVCLDETPVGAFVEIEGPAEAIHELARHLGFHDYIKQSYIDLYTQRLKGS